VNRTGRSKESATGYDRNLRNRSAANTTAGKFHEADRDQCGKAQILTDNDRPSAVNLRKEKASRRTNAFHEIKEARRLRRCSKLLPRKQSAIYFVWTTFAEEKSPRALDGVSSQRFGM